jgi:DNA-binding transcriptional LysR family regulator
MEAERNRLSVVPDDAIEGLVRLSTTEGLATLLVDRGLGQLTRRHRGLSLELLAGNRPVDLAAGEADLALRTTEPTEAGVRVRRIATLSLGLYRATTYPDPGDDPRGQDVILPAGELARLPEATWLAGIDGVRVVLRTSSLVALHAAVRSGAGLGVLPTAWAALEPTLCLVCPAPVPPRALWLALAPEAAGRAAVRHVAEQVEVIVRGTDSR